MLIKRLLIVWLLTITVTISVQAATFYVSNAGNDANDGLSPETAWQSFEKVSNTLLEDGSQVLFKRGDVFRGKMSLFKFPKNITISAYGEGENPVISGSVVITDWQPSSLGKGIFEANTSNLPLFEEDIQHLFVNGELMTIARYPNVDAPNEKHWLETGEESLNSGKSTFVDPVLAAYTKPNDYWKGALLRIRTYSWTYTVFEISGYDATKGKITTKAAGDFVMGAQYPGWGYFIDSKLEELDHPGEWYYDKAQKKIYLMPRHSINPNEALVEGMTHNIGIGIGEEESGTTIENLTFQHFTEQGVKLGGTENITVQNCHFEHNHVGLYTWNVANVKILHNTFDKQFKDGIGLQAAKGFDVQDSVIENNIITNTAMYPIYGRRYAGVYQGIGITAFGSQYTIRRNYIENAGYAGISLKDEGKHVAENNVIRNTLQLLNDGGALLNGSDANIIRGNFLLDTWGNVDESNGWGGSSGMHHSTYGMGVGAEGELLNSIIENNVIANNRDIGIALTSYKNTEIRNNIIYNNDPQISVKDNSGPSSNNQIEDNIIYSLDPDQVGLLWYNNTEHGSSNNNFFCNPYNTLMGTRDGKHYSLRHWQSLFKKLDQNSRFCDFSTRDYITEEIGNNLITNTTFDSDISGWKGIVTHDPNKLGMDGGSLKFEGGEKVTPITYKGFELQANQFYRLRFSVIGNGFGSLRIGISSEDWQSIVDKRFYPYETVRHDYELVFSSPINAPNSRLLFSQQEQDEKIYWMDNVSLYPVNAQVVAKTEQSKLVMNPTESVNTIELPAGVEFFDLQGQSVTSQITLEPYSATVLVRSDNNIPPSAPYLNLMQNGRRVTASWAPVTGATGYRLYYAEYPNAPEIFNIDMGEKRELSVDLFQGAAFYVAVAAYNAFGESGYSNIRHFIVKQ